VGNVFALRLKLHSNRFILSKKAEGFIIV